MHSAQAGPVLLSTHVPRLATATAMTLGVGVGWVELAHKLAVPLIRGDPLSWGGGGRA